MLSVMALSESPVTAALAAAQDKIRAVADVAVVEVANGLLMLMQVHLMSIVNIRHLVNKKAARLAAKGLPDTAALRSNRK